MPEVRQIQDLRTLAFIGQGTFTLVSQHYNTKESSYRAGETYITGIHLELASPAGGKFAVDIPKRDIAFAQLDALFINIPGASKLTFDWSPTEKRVIITAAV